MEIWEAHSHPAGLLWEPRSGIVPAVYLCGCRISYRYVLETHSHNEVAGPVAEAGDSNGSRARALAEQLSHDKPGDGPRPHFEEDDEEEDCNHADIAHPGKLALQEVGVTVPKQLPLIITNYFIWASFSEISFYADQGTGHE